MLKYIVLGLLGLFVALAVYVRLAPTDTAYWHNPDVPKMEPGEYPGADRYLVQRQLEGNGTETLTRLDGIILATPRTQILAGSLEDGKITYITRSKVMGFPDYTTVTLAQNPAASTSMLQVFGRLRFGKMDMGVNRARIEQWLDELDQETPTR